MCGLDTVSKEEFTGQPKDLDNIPSPNYAESLRITAALKALVDATKPRVDKVQKVRCARVMFVLDVAAKHRLSVYLRT